jgi:hypothetical protein
MAVWSAALVQSSPFSSLSAGWLSATCLQDNTYYDRFTQSQDNTYYAINKF